jgi:HK97 family phage major capsid protein
MKSSKEIRETIGALEDRIDAIIDVATESGRDLTEPERSEIDGIQGRGSEGDADYVPSKLERLQDDARRAEQIEERQLARARERASTRSIPTQHGIDDEPAPRSSSPRLNRIAIPAQCRFRYSHLKAFSGPDADKKAYMAGRFYMAILWNDHDSKQWCHDNGIDTRYKAVLKEATNELGGVLVPEEVEQTIIDLREQFGVFRREARDEPMVSDTKVIPRRTGGVTAYFGDEAPASGMTETDKSWDHVRLTAKKLYVLTRYSTEVGEDAIISIGDDLTNEIAYAFASKEDDCGFLGDGTSTYGGITGLINAIAAGSKVTAASGNTAFSTLDLTDFEDMVGKLPTYAEGNAKWYISKAGYAASMMRLIDAAGGNTIATLQNGANMREFLGYPVVIAQKMNNTLTAQTSTDGLCYFGDLRQAAAFGNRRGMSILMSEHRYMEFDEIGIRGTERFDLNVHETGTASAAGAIIMLSTPSS